MYKDFWQYCHGRLLYCTSTAVPCPVDMEPSVRPRLARGQRCCTLRCVAAYAAALAL